jgi:tetratricopeptide (TPR) repeat protein
MLHNISGAAHQSLGQLDAAINSFTNATIIKPDYAEGYYNLGVTLKKQGKLEKAIEAYQKALAIKPDHPESINNIGAVLKDQSKLEEAIGAYKKALVIKPDYVDAYYNMGNVLQEQGKLEEAIEAYNKALAIKPDFAEAYYNIANTRKDQGKLDKALEYYNKAIIIQPDYAKAHLNMSFLLLNKGSLKEALEKYEWRWHDLERSRKMRRFSKPAWSGAECLKRKNILLWGEQGPQDIMIWSSCIQYLTPLVKQCIFECPEKLVSLFTRSFPNVEVRPENKSKDMERDDFDFHLPMGSLFQHFIPEISSQSTTDTFLTPDSARVQFWRNRLKSLGEGPFIGISWKSPSINSQRAPNYTQISDWAPIFDLHHATFINLQSTEFSEDLEKIRDDFGIIVHNFADLDHYNNLDDVAALAAALDIAVSVSTAVCAITAGVGTATKLAAWRQSPWNNILLSPKGPAVDVFERNTWEPWDNVFQSIARNIQNLELY